MIEIGPCHVGADCLIDASVVLGYPSKTSLAEHRDFGHSQGMMTGEGCILRLGTVIYERARLGSRIQTAHHVVIREDTEIGDGCVFGSGTVVREGAKLGRNVRLMENVVVSEGAVLENDIFIGPGVVMTAGRFMTGALQAAGKLDVAEAAKLEKSWQTDAPSVFIGDRARVGSNAVLLAGVRLGADCVVAAGSVVTFDIPPGATVMGNPGRIVKVAP